MNQFSEMVPECRSIFARIAFVRLRVPGFGGPHTDAAAIAAGYEYGRRELLAREISPVFMDGVQRVSRSS